MAQVGIEQLLEAGVHFGHQTRRWNPKMRRFIFGERDGIYIIDLLKTADLLAQAQNFASEVARRGGTVLFVGTKKQARDAVKEIAESSGMPYVNHRWLGGLLTNFQTMSLRIRRLHDLERYEAEGQLALLPTRERMAAQADLAKLRANLGGVKDMQRVPDAVFVIDLKTEAIAVREAQRLRVPIVGLVDTNCDPDGVDYVIPGNDDAIRSCALITKAIGDVVAESHAAFRAQEERARQEAQERERREAEARAKREAEAQAKREAEEQEQREQAQREEAEAAFAAHKAAQAAAAQQATQGQAPPAQSAAQPAGQAQASASAPAAAPAQPAKEQAAAPAPQAPPSAAPAPQAPPSAAPAPQAPAAPAPQAPAAPEQQQAPAETEPQPPAEPEQAPAPAAPEAPAPAADAQPQADGAGEPAAPPQQEEQTEPAKEASA